MTKKTLKKKVQAKASSGKLSDSVMDSAREIWLAGLGAFSIAQQESGKLLDQGSKLVAEGNKLFDKLVAEGAKLEKNTRDVADGKVVNLRGEMESRVESVRKQASDNWDRLEGIFEERVARVLGSLGVPTADDVNKLSARVQKLSEQVAGLNTKPAAKAAKPATKPAAKKVAKKAPVKKAAAK
jgi:poly(hydroxyalkanoate) granule-associated protein